MKRKNKSLRRQEDVRLLDEEVFEEFEDEEDFSESDNFSADDSFDDDDIDDDELYEDEDEEGKKNEWLSLMDALEKGLCRNSLLEFYYVSRAILVKTEADLTSSTRSFWTTSTASSTSRTSPRNSWTGSTTPRT